MAYLVLTTTGMRQLDTFDEDEWSALDVWRNATLAFIYSAFLEIILVKDMVVRFLRLWKYRFFPDMCRQGI